MKSALVVLFCIAGALAIPANKINERIVGGEIAEDGQFPYQGSLKVNGNHTCGGAILDETTIITAAHCVFPYPAGDITILLGTNQLDDASVPNRKIKNYIYHQGYDEKDYSNDIALIKLVDPIEFNEKVQPVTLPTSDIADDVDVILSGWGDKDAVPIPNDLKFIQMETTAHLKCEYYNLLPVTEKQVCATAFFGTGPCFGDYGSPLVDASGAFVGILSFGNKCALEHPDVFTRIYSYLTWIEYHK